MSDPKIPPLAEAISGGFAAVADQRVAQQQDAAEDDGREEYTVTKLAGPKVAGQRLDGRKTIRLTEEEARSELLNGAVEPKGEKPSDKSRSKSA